jgi:hypothetical protein
MQFIDVADGRDTTEVKFSLPHDEAKPRRFPRQLKLETGDAFEVPRTVSVRWYELFR